MCDPYLSLDCALPPSNPGTIQGKEGIEFCFVLPSGHPVHRLCITFKDNLGPGVEVVESSVVVPIAEDFCYYDRVPAKLDCVAEVRPGISLVPK